MTITPRTVIPALLTLVVGFSAGLFFSVAAQDQKVYELRTYTATRATWAI
ncbi:MAG: hypothetical protein ACE37N_00255 [Pseudohongiellaceae bacterium]